MASWRACRSPGDGAPRPACLFSDLPAATSRDLENRRVAVGAQLRAGLGGIPPRSRRQSTSSAVSRASRPTGRAVPTPRSCWRGCAPHGSDWTLARKGFERALSLRDSPVATSHADFEGIEVYTEALAQEGDNRARCFSRTTSSPAVSPALAHSLPLADAFAARAERRQEEAQSLESRKDVERVLAIRRAHLAAPHAGSGRRTLACRARRSGSTDASRGARRVSNRGGDGGGLAWPRPRRGRALPARPRAGSGTAGRPHCRPGHGLTGHRAMRGRAAARSSRDCVAVQRPGADASGAG